MGFVTASINLVSPVLSMFVQVDYALVHNVLDNILQCCSEAEFEEVFGGLTFTASKSDQTPMDLAALSDNQVTAGA